MLLESLKWESLLPVAIEKAYWWTDGPIRDVLQYACAVQQWVVTLQAAIYESATNFWLLGLSILHNHAAQPRQPYYQASYITLGRRV